MSKVVQSFGGRSATASAASTEPNQGGQDPAALDAERMLEQQGILLETIARLARAARSVLADSIQQMGGGEPDEIDQAATSVEAAEALLSQLGFLADLGAQQVGQSRQVGDAADWMLPYRFHHLVKGGVR